MSFATYVTGPPFTDYCPGVEVLGYVTFTVTYSPPPLVPAGHAMMVAAGSGRQPVARLRPPGPVMPCLHCPVAPGQVCRGTENPIWCRHMDRADPLYQPGYARILVADDVIVAVPGPARPPPAEAARLLRLMKACEFRSPGETGCGCGHCGLRRGAAVSHLECFECLRKYPPG